MGLGVLLLAASGIILWQTGGLDSERTSDPTHSAERRPTRTRRPSQTPELVPEVTEETETAAEAEVAAAPITPSATPTLFQYTSTPLPSATPTATLTSTPSPTPSRTPTRTRTRTPSPSPTSCAAAVYSGFRNTWQDYASQLGCPTVGRKSGVSVAQELFQYGRMLWREDNDRIYVLYNSGYWERYRDIWREGDSEFSCGTPQNPPTPKRGFGKTWCTYSGVRQGLGNATNGEWGDRVVLQTFSGGLMLQPSSGRIYTFFNDGTWK